MRLAAGLLLLVPALSGCLGGNDDVVEDPGPDPIEKRLGDPLTLGGVLNRTNHINVQTQSTIKWEFTNVTEGFRVWSSLLYFGQELPISKKSMLGEPVFVGFIPLNATESVSGCGELPKGLKDYFRPRDGATDGNLKGKFKPGWYHAVLITNKAGSFSITFNSTTELTPIKPSKPDPYVTGGGGYLDTGRTPTLTAENLEGAWFAWATHQLADPNVVDGGRTHRVTIGGDCRKTERVQETAQSPAYTTAQKLSVDASGKGSSVEIKGLYEPKQDVSQAQNTKLWAVWASIVEPEIPTALPEDSG